MEMAEEMAGIIILNTVKPGQCKLPLGLTKTDHITQVIILGR